VVLVSVQGVQNEGAQFKFTRFEVISFSIYAISEVYELLFVIVFLL